MTQYNQLIPPQSLSTNMVLEFEFFSASANPSRDTVHPPQPVLWPVRSPCRTTPKQLPSVLGPRPSLRRPRMPRHRLPLPVAASRPPTSSSRRRSPRPPSLSRRLPLPVSACHLRLPRHLPRPRPRSSSPPPLRPTKTRSSPDFTFRRPQCSTSASW
jgi:hypothetical protein